MLYENHKKDYTRIKAHVFLYRLVSKLVVFRGFIPTYGLSYWGGHSWPAESHNVYVGRKKCKVDRGMENHA